ncbi:MAG: hypothetical protein ACSLFI_01345 [Solirubrobacterales bacterium]
MRTETMSRIEADRDGILGRDVRRWTRPRFWVLACAVLLLLGYYCIVSGLFLYDRTSDIVVGVLVLLGANWWWRRRTRKDWAKANPGLPARKGGFVQAFYQPLLAVVWDLRNWF